VINNHTNNMKHYEIRYIYKPRQRPAHKIKSLSIEARNLIDAIGRFFKPPYCPTTRNGYYCKSSRLELVSVCQTVVVKG